MEKDLTRIEPIIVASILQNPSWIGVAANKLDPEDFEKEYLGEIFEQMVTLKKRGKKPTSEALISSMGGDSDYIDHIQEIYEPEEDDIVFSQYVDDLHEKGAMDHALDTIDEMSESMEKHKPETLNDLTKTIQRYTSQIQEKANRGSVSVSDSNQLVNIFQQDFAERAASDDLVKGERTGFDELDETINGMNPGNYIVIAGRPGMGKTTLAMNICTNVVKRGGRAFVASQEMPSSQLMRRMFASLSSIELNKLKTAQLTQHEGAALKQSMEEFKEYDLVICDEAGITIDQFEFLVTQAHEEKGLSVAMIDYLQLMSTRGAEGATRNEKIGEISNRLKKLALRLKIPIIILSQLSRGVEERQDKRPINSDLRDAGAIEQDADIILFTYRDEIYDPDTRDKGIGEIILSKQRDGDLANIRTIFEGQYSRFRQFERKDKAVDGTISGTSADGVL